MTSLLYVAAALLPITFVFQCVTAWRIYGGRARPRPAKERAATAALFAIVGWQALNWLLADQPTAPQARIAGVWLELLAAFGVSAVLLAQGWLEATPHSGEFTICHP